LGNLTNLDELELDNNQLTGEIPPELGNLTNLVNLWLSGNQFTGCIPESLRAVQNNDLGELGLGFCGEEPADSCIMPIDLGEARRGEWSADCKSVTSTRLIVEGARGSGPHYALYYTFTLDEPADVTITLYSDEDTFLYLLAGAGASVEDLITLDVVRYNDDYGNPVQTDTCADTRGIGEYDSCITESLDAGDYTIEATTYDSGTLGGFAIFLRE
jgi:hypothetical protein